MSSYIAKSARVRSTPFTKRIEEYGVQSYTVYNHMLLPASFKGIEEDYYHLKKMFNCGMFQSNDKYKLKDPMHLSLLN